jgi:hypothetical protein
MISAPDRPMSCSRAINSLVTDEKQMMPGRSGAFSLASSTPAAAIAERIPAAPTSSIAQNWNQALLGDKIQLQAVAKALRDVGFSD